MSKNYLTQTVESITNFAANIEKWLSGIFSRFSGRKITVETEVKGAEKVEGIKRDVESLPKAKTLEVKVEKRGDFSDLSLTGKELKKTISVESEVSGLDQVRQLNQDISTLPKTITVAPPPVSQWTKLKDEFVGLRSNVNDLGGGLKNLTGKLMASGGALMIIYQGFKSLIKIGQHFYNSWIDGMKEAAAMSEQNAEC